MMIIGIIESSLRMLPLWDLYANHWCYTLHTTISCITW